MPREKRTVLNSLCKFIPIIILTQIAIVGTIWANIQQSKQIEQLYTWTEVQQDLIDTLHGLDKFEAKK